MAYIERDIFINNELIPLVKTLDLCHPKQKKGVLMAISKLKEAPTADVVEVVRCKDCAIPHNKWLGCPKMNGLIPPPNHFCSYGERKECTDQKSVTNFECFKKNIAKMSIDELAKVIKDSDNCEKFCVFAKDEKALKESENNA